MSRISKALDKLRAKCTMAGAHPKGNGTADILECIAEHFQAGTALPEVTSDDDGKVLKVVDGEWDTGTALPEVTSEDEGKVLKVVDGEWGKGEAGGGETLIVHFTMDVEGSIIADKTYDEVMEAMKTMPIVGNLKMIFGGEEQIVPMGVAMYSYVDTYETPCWCLIDRDGVRPTIGWDSENRKWNFNG